MSRADELRRLADLLDEADRLAADMESAREAHRADPENPELRQAYRNAVARLQEARAAERADRSGMTVTAEIAEG